MAAAAGCRASTALGGYGAWGNAVFPRTSGHTCVQACKNTKTYTECDASLSIMGFMGRVKTGNRAAGWYYNYHCNSIAHNPHEDTAADSIIRGQSAYYGYCCCRHK